MSSLLCDLLGLILIDIRDERIGRFDPDRLIELGVSITDMVRVDEWTGNPALQCEQCHGGLDHFRGRNNLLILGATAQTDIDRDIHLRIPRTRIDLNPLVSQTDNPGLLLMLDNQPKDFLECIPNTGRINLCDQQRPLLRAAEQLIDAGRGVLQRIGVQTL